MVFVTPQMVYTTPCLKEFNWNAANWSISYKPIISFLAGKYNLEHCLTKRIRNCWFLNVGWLLQDKDQTEYKDWDNVKGEGRNKEKKESIISFANTVVYPRAMMIKILKKKRNIKSEDMLRCLYHYKAYIIPMINNNIISSNIFNTLPQERVP